jgi:polar amino acid transport system substrate-binding protein
MYLKKNIAYYVLFTLVSGVLAAPAFAQTLKIGYVEFPPMTYTDRNGQPAGYVMDIALKSLEKAGFEWTAVSLPAKRLAKSLAAGNIQVWLGLATLPQFKGTTHVGKTVVEQLILRAYTIGSKPPVRKRRDLLGKTLLILRGYSYGGWITFIKDPANKIQHLEFDSHAGAFKRLEKLSRRIPEIYLLDYKHPSETVLKKLDLPGIRFNQISSLDMHFVVTRKMDGAKAVLDRIENAFQQLSASGSF